ncbi:MAG: nucleotide exchange factor GrpE [Deltaproteobacteria bacterium]|nr:nucleotide exchange factor GrpE [Deltaproteobacteria bacterium]
MSDPKNETEAEGGTLELNPELEAALREATESVDARRAASSEDAKPEAKHDATEALIHAYKAEAEKLGQELEAARQEAAGFKDRFVRVSADLDNLRRRQLKERQEALQYGHENLVKDLLNTVDNLDRAIDHAKGSDAKDLSALLQGVELAQRELTGVLGKHGVVVIEAEGVAFDPNVHEAVAQIEEGSVPPGHVARVYQKGYRLRDRLLRPARVVVAMGVKANPGSEEPVN